MKNTIRTACSIIALAGASLATSAFAHGTVSQEAWGSEKVAMQMQHGSELSRAEVLADMSLWRRAGLQYSNTGEGQRMASMDYQQRLADYQRMRSGPEYAAEVQRFGGDVSTVAVYTDPQWRQSNY